MNMSLLYQESVDLIESHKELCCLIYDIDLTIPKDEGSTRKKQSRGYTTESI